MKHALVALVALVAAVGCARPVSFYVPATLADRNAPVAVVDPKTPADLGENPQPLKRSPATLPVPSEGHLSNGVRLLFVEHHHLPLVAVSFILRFDASEGVTVVPDLYALAMTGGSDTYSSRSNKLFRGLAGVTALAQRDSDALVLQASMLAPHATTAIDRLAATLAAPAFETKDIDTDQHKLLDERMRARQYPSAMIAAQRMLLGEAHPARIRTFGIQQIRAASRDGLRAFKKANLSAENLTVVVVGDFKRTEIERLLEARLGRLPSTSPHPTRTSAPAWEHATAPKARIEIVPWRGATQSKVAIAFDGPPPRSRDRAVLAVLDDVLTSSEGRLQRLIREDKGASYGVHGGLEFWRTGSAFQIVSSVEARQTVSTVDTIVREIRRLATELVPNEELARAKGHVVAGARSGDSPVARDHSLVTTIATQDLPLDHFVNAASRVEAVTSEDIRAAAAKYLRAEYAQIAVAGDPASVEAPLRALGIGDVSFAPPLP